MEKKEIVLRHMLMSNGAHAIIIEPGQRETRGAGIPFIAFPWREKFNNIYRIELSLTNEGLIKAVGHYSINETDRSAKRISKWNPIGSLIKDNYSNIRAVLEAFKESCQKENFHPDALHLIGFTELFSRDEESKAGYSVLSWLKKNDFNIAIIWE